MPSFTQLGVPPKLVASLTSRGVTTPFPIQAATITEAMAGRDLCGRAPTGSGKTLAFAIPLAARAGKGGTRRPRALVLVPTRELAAQITRELQPLATICGRTVATFYGGTPINKDRGRSRRGVDIAVACPGRLADLVRQGEVDLGDVDMVVVDEADRMADMGFLPEVRRLLDSTAADRQTLLFSATLDGDVDVLVRHYQRDPVRYELDADPRTQGEVQHLFLPVESPARVELAAQIVLAVPPAIVFTRTKHSADQLARRLQRQGVSAAAIHGNRTQSQRERALADFTAGRITALVATDVAARGLHIEGVGVVVHFDPPASDKDYIHRSGRTGRAGADGLVVTLVLPERRGDVRSLQRSLRLPQRMDSIAIDQLAASDRPSLLTAQPVPPSPRPARAHPAVQREGGPGRPRRNATGRRDSRVQRSARRNRTR